MPPPDGGGGTRMRDGGRDPQRNTKMQKATREKEYGSSSRSHLRPPTALSPLSPTAPVPPPGRGREKFPTFATQSPTNVVACFSRERRGKGKFSLPPRGEREEKATVWLFLEAKSQAQGAREAICDCDNERLCGRTGKGWRGVAETGRSKRQRRVTKMQRQSSFYIRRLPPVALGDRPPSRRGARKNSKRQRGRRRG